MTTNQQKLANETFLKKKAITLISKAIAKISLKFRLPRSEIINAFDEQLVLEAKKQDADASQVTIAIRTGINRRYIPKYLKGEMPDVKPNKLEVILEDIRWTAQQYYNSNKLPKLGHFRTFQSICEQRASGSLTYHAILDELIINGNIKDLGDKVELIDFMNLPEKNNINYPQLTALQFNNIANTIIFNSTTDSLKERYVQRSIFTSQVNPVRFKPLHQDIRRITKKYNSEITDLFISYEESVNVGTFPEYGVSFLEYQKEK